MNGSLLEKVDRLAELVAELRAEVAAMVAEDECEKANDLADHNLISVQAASERWHIPADTLRHKLRAERHLGVKRGNVWWVSLPRLARRLRRG